MNHILSNKDLKIHPRRSASQRKPQGNPLTGLARDNTEQMEEEIPLYKHEIRKCKCLLLVKRIQPEILPSSSKFGMMLVTEAHMESKSLQMKKPD